MPNNIDSWLQLTPSDWLVRDRYEVLSENEKRTRFELVDKLMLPLPKRVPHDFKDLRGLLQYEWRMIIDAYRVNFEDKYCYESVEEAFDDWDLWSEDDEEIKSLHINTDVWIAQARSVFGEKIKHFYSALATEQDYNKHFSNPNWPDQRIIAESYKRALLLPLVDTNYLDQMFVQMAEYFSDAIYYNHCFKFIVETDQLCGYSQGIPCTHLLFKLDPVQIIYHVYPIPDKEIAPNKAEWMELEDGEEIVCDNLMDADALNA